MTAEEIKVLYSTSVEEHTEEAFCKALNAVNPTLYGIFATYCADNGVNYVDAMFTFWENNAPHKDTLTEGLKLAVSVNKHPVRLNYTPIEVSDVFVAALYNGLTLFT